MNKTEIVTERIKLRLIDLSELESIHDLHSLPETDAYNALGIPETIEETKSVIQPWILEHQLKEIKNYRSILLRQQYLQSNLFVM